MEDLAHLGLLASMASRDHLDRPRQFLDLPVAPALLVLKALLAMIQT